MIEIYLGVGIVFAIINLMVVYSKHFSEFEVKMGRKTTDFRKILFVLLLIPLYPVFIAYLFMKEKPTNG